VVDKDLLFHAFKRGASSVLFIEDPPDSPKAEIIYPLTVSHFEKLKKKLEIQEIGSISKKPMFQIQEGLQALLPALPGKER